MIGKMLKGCTAAIVVFSLCATTLADELVDNPRYQDWAKYKPGTFIRTVTVTGGNRKMNIFRTSTLKEVTPEKVVLEMKSSMEMPGMPPKETAVVVVEAAKIEKSKLGDETVDIEQILKHPNFKLINKGSEDLNMGGKTCKCNWYEVEVEQQGRKLARKYWLCNDVPDKLVKTEFELGEGTSSTALVAFEAVAEKHGN